MSRMFTEAPLEVSERRPRKWGARKANDVATVANEKRQARPKRASAVAPSAAQRKHVGPRRSTAVEPRSEPEGWQRRLREQAHNLARAIEMLEQAVAMMSEPREGTLARAECLRGAGIITMLAASELLVVAGWFEADQAVKAGTLEA